jgi:hypothetical protein
MADRNESAQELLLDVRVAEASKLYKFYLSQEKKILGAAGVTIFLIVWELVGNVPTYQSDVHECAFAYRQSRDRPICIG